MDKNKLLYEIFENKTDKDKFDTLRQYSNIKLYRYRFYDGNQNYEFDALRNRNVWLSRPDKFDDDCEGTIIKAGKKDIKTIFTLLDKMDKSKLMDELRNGKAGEVINKSGFINPKDVQSILRKENTSYNNLNFINRKKFDINRSNTMMKEYRLNYLMACFSENNPMDQFNNMWKQYCSDEDGKVSGFCLEYSLFDLLEQEVIIAPIFYKSEATISDICNKFNYHIECIFMHKEEQGYDSKKDPKHTNKISWKDQNEWRIVKMNDNSKNEGNNLDKKLIPSKVYYLDVMPNEEEFLSLLDIDGKHIEAKKVHKDSIL